MLKSFIRKKQSSSQEEWLEVYYNIEKYVSKDHIDKITREAVDRLKFYAVGKNLAYGWTAGKDSLVLEKLCDMAGITKSFMYITQLELTDMIEYIEKHKPKGLETIVLDLDLDWLAEDEENRLFPKDAKSEYNIYFKRIQAFGFRDYQARKHLDGIVVGHRKKDGNYCPEFVTKGKDGLVKIHPIKDWSNEEILGFIVYNRIKLPKTYFYDEGFVEGTGSWAQTSRENRTVAECWEYIYKYDPENVIKAATKLKTAKEFIDNVRKKNN